MKQITAIIESGGNNFSAYIAEIDGIIATGSSIDEIKSKLCEAITTYTETCEEIGCAVPEEISGEYEITFRMDVKSLLEIYNKIFSKSGLEKLTGINQKQLWHYANGRSRPRPAQMAKIENALHKLGRELIAIQF